MGLDVLLAGKVVGVGRRDARRRRGQRQVGAAVGQHHGAVVGVGARQLELDVAVGELVLDRLVGADGAAEGLALQGVVARHPHRRFGAAHLGEGEVDRGRVVETLERAPALAFRAQKLGGGVLEGELGMLACRIDGLDALLGHGRLLEIDQHQRHGAIALPAGVGQHDREGRGLAVGHRHLLAVEPAAAEGRADAARLGRLRALGDGERADRLAGRQRGQPLLLLRVRARELQRLGRQHDRRVERHRRRRASHFLGDDAELERREAEPAVLFGNAGRRHAELDEALPDLVGMSLVAVQHATHDLGRALVGEELTDLLLEQLLVVGEIEVHDGQSLASALASGNGRRFRQAGAAM